MEESKIKKMIREKDNTLSEEDINEIYQILLENNKLPKNETELNQLFVELDEFSKTHIEPFLKDDEAEE